MANLIDLGRPFTRMIRDVSRDSLPQGSAWNLLDLIPGELNAPLAKRGGWSYESADLTSYVASGANRVTDVFSAPFSGGHQLLAWVRRDTATAGNRLIQVTSTSSETDRGSAFQPTQWPVFYRDKVYAFNSSGIQSYDGSSNIASVGGTPQGSLGCVYKDHLVNADSSAQPQRVWFSAAGDATTWDTTNGYIDTDDEVMAIYPLRNQILIWHRNKMERIIGSIPPPGTDMYLQPVWDVGCPYPNSLAGTDQWVMFANATGVYRTDGAEVLDVTRAGGMRAYWQTLFPSGAGRRVAAGFFRGYYFVTVHDASPLATIDTFMIELGSWRWMRISNISATSFSRRTMDREELYWADSERVRANSLGSIFSPSSSVKNDADGTAVTWTLETPYYRLGRSKGRVKTVYVNYDMRDAASDNPSITVSAVYSPESTSYTSLSPTLSETSEEDDARVALNKLAFGFGLKLVQSNASSTTRLNSLHVDAHPREGSALA